MKLLRQYWLVFLLLLLIAAAVLARTFCHSLFKYDAGRLAEPSALKTNLITEEQLSSFKGAMLLVNLGETGMSGDIQNEFSMQVSPDSILVNKYLDKITHQKGPVILSCADNSVSARIWMILSQLGIRNLYILTADLDPEILKKEFRPDSLSGPEF
jgi:hypothetical protein